MILAPFGTLERTRTSGLPLRRRSRYPLRYQGLCKIFNFFVTLGECSYYRLGVRCMEYSVISGAFYKSSQSLVVQWIARI